MTTKYLIADLFCGAGGSSSGALRAIRRMGATMDLVAVNHWDIAIATHTRNHPEARHHCIDLDAARPETLVPEGSLDLLMASPECQHHSRARGGKPVSDQRRVSAWHVQRWASTLSIRCILVENVAEFQEWGPLLPNGRPDPMQKGVYFQAWIQALWGMGYQVDWRILNAADYGDATTRSRFFLQARKDGVNIRWPEPTHSPTGDADMFGTRPRWKAAREVIDWSNPGRSLLTRSKPLSLKTRLRIARGLARFGGPLAGHYINLLDLPLDDAMTFQRQTDAAIEAAPFIAAQRNHTLARGVGEPLPTITASQGGGTLALVSPGAEPFVLGKTEHMIARSLTLPLPTLTTDSGPALIEPHAEPFILGQQSCSIARLIDEPLPTIAAAGAISLTAPSLIPYYSTGVADSVDEPLATVTTKARFGLCNPLAVPYGPKAEARDVASPLPTILTRDRLGLATPIAEPFLVPQFGERDGQLPRVHSVNAPMPAVTSHGAGALVNPSLVQVNHAGESEGRVQSVEVPLPTVTAKRSVALIEPTAVPAVAGDIDPRRLVSINGQPYLLDIRFRMLQNRELARAMGFDDAEVEYEFTGNIGEVTRQIGNAVAVGTAAALVTAIFGAGGAA